MNQRLDVTVHGRVQGVFYRKNTQRIARGLALSGTVENRFDGTVRVTAEGERGALESLLQWLRHGPEGAQVDRVDVTWSQPQGEEKGFTIVG